MVYLPIYCFKFASCLLSCCLQLKAQHGDVNTHAWKYSCMQKFGNQHILLIV